MKKNKMMEKYEIKTCGTCVHFMKSSCEGSGIVLPESSVCSKYQETYYTPSATSPTTKLSIPIMKEENKLKYTIVSVYKVNEKCIVARSIEDAIKLYEDIYKYPYNTVKQVYLIEEDAWIKSDKDDENTTANMQDCVSSKDYVVQCDYTAKADEKD